MADQDINNAIRRAMIEWSDIKTELKNARKDIKVLNTREKELNLYIKKFMSMKKIDACKVKDSKVSLNKKKAKKGLTKEVIYNALVEFFELKIQSPQPTTPVSLSQNSASS